MESVWGAVCVSLSSAKGQEPRPRLGVSMRAASLVLV